jgi:glyoxylase-like metal-dependent hydrolase (beta-lactamase superfamily II)
MWIRADGQLSESTYLLTTPVSSHLVAFGEEAAIVDAGIASFGVYLVEALQNILAADLPLKYLLLTHAHPDHVGGVASIRSTFPGLQLVCSSLTAELLTDPGLFERNCQLAEGLGARLEISAEQFYRVLVPDRILGEGDSINLGADVQVKVVSCPGHTSDTTGYLVTPDSALAAAEAVGGYNGRDKIAPCFLHSREAFIQTLDKLLTLDLKVVALAHSGALTADLAKRFLLGVREHTLSFHESIKKRIAEGAVKEELYFDLLSEWGVDGLSPEGPFVQEQELAVKRMVELCLDD